jgi:hypothetical protein
MFATVVTVLCTWALAALGLFPALHEKLVRKRKSHVWVLFVAIGLLGTASALYHEWQTSVEAEETKKREIGLATGGDSFCHFEPDINDATSSIVRGLVVQHGEYTVYAIQVRIVPLDETGELIKGIDWSTQALQLQVQEISPGKAEMITLSNPIAIGGTSVAMNVFIDARNGGWAEKIRLHRGADGHWLKAIRVDLGPGRDPFVDVTKGFPTITNWDKGPW